MRYYVNTIFKTAQPDGGLYKGSPLPAVYYEDGFDYLHTAKRTAKLLMKQGFYQRVFITGFSDSGSPEGLQWEAPQ